MQTDIFQKGYWTLIRSFSPNPWTLLGNSQMLEIEKTGKKELGGKQNPWRLNGLKCVGGRVYLEDFPAMPFVFAARHSRILMMQKHSENINAAMRKMDTICDFVKG